MAAPIYETPQKNICKVRLKKAKYAFRRPWRLIWHPHQGIWNHYLLTIFRAGLLQNILVLTDTVARILQACVRRLRYLGVRSLFSNPLDANDSNHLARIVFIDAGLHRVPNQSILFAKWFGAKNTIHIIGYEALREYAHDSERYFAETTQRDLGIGNVSFVIRNVALVGPESNAATIRLFRAPGDGKGDSLLRGSHDKFSEVSAVRLSDDLQAHGIELKRDILLLRMNIEGAEHLVLRDLLEANYLSSIDGFYGMWDDLWKHSPPDDEEMLRFMRKNHVRPFTFNDRDSDNWCARLRLWAIKYDMVTTIAKGVASKCD